MLKLKEVKECLYPSSIEEAARILREKGEKAKVVGGGLHISAFPNPLIETLIFLNKIDLNYILIKEGFFHIGALVSITELTENNELKGFLRGNVTNAFCSIASELLRNQISMGGSIAQREPYSDVATILLTLDSKVIFHNGNIEETVPLEELYIKNFRLILKESVIKEIIFPNYDNSYHFGMRRFVRNATDIPLLNVAILSKIESNKLKNIRIFVGARPAPAYRFKTLEDFLKDKEINEGLIKSAREFTKENVEVEDDMRVSKDYRKQIAGVFVEKILTEFLKEA